MGIEVGGPDEAAQHEDFVAKLRAEAEDAGALVGASLGEAFKRIEPL